MEQEQSLFDDFLGIREIRFTTRNIKFIKVTNIIKVDELTGKLDIVKTTTDKLYSTVPGLLDELTK